MKNPASFTNRKSGLWASVGLAAIALSSAASAQDASVLEESETTTQPLPKRNPMPSSLPVRALQRSRLITALTRYRSLARRSPEGKVASILPALCRVRRLLQVRPRSHQRCRRILLPMAVQGHRRSICAAWARTERLSSSMAGAPVLQAPEAQCRLSTSTYCRFRSLTTSRS